MAATSETGRLPSYLWIATDSVSQATEKLRAFEAGNSAKIVA
jgi:hypothetical protein